ncbi:MAG: HEAT repeat domain-containing protein [Chthoniobacter sp.]|nr:HEAT repeat domain-containing protein [Chthoniobacter sp.]
MLDESPRGSHSVSMWERAIAALQGKREQGRPLVAGMLRSENTDTRANGVAVLMSDERQHLEPYRASFLKLLADRSARVRMNSAAILAKVKDQDTESALLKAIFRDDASDDEIRIIAATLCTEPVDEGKVIPAMVRLMDKSRSSMAVIWTTMQASARLAQSKAHGEKLIACYWQVLSTTSDSGLASIAAGAFPKDDERTLKYLRQSADIANPVVRQYAVSALAGHGGFDPQREAGLFKKLVNDSHPRARAWFIGSLCSRKRGISTRYHIPIALKIWHDDPDEEVQTCALNSIFDVLEQLTVYQLLKDRSLIMADQTLSLPHKMLDVLNGQGKESWRRIILFRTGALDFKLRSIPDGARAAEVKAWWQSQEAAAH